MIPMILIRLLAKLSVWLVKEPRASTQEERERHLMCNLGDDLTARSICFAVRSRRNREAVSTRVLSHQSFRIAHKASKVRK